MEDSANRVVTVTRRHRDAGGFLDLSSVEGLIIELEAGSSVAEQRVAALVLSESERPSEKRPQDDERPGLGVDRDFGEDRSALDRLALSAAAGSPYSLELLLSIIVDHELAGPSIGRITSGRSVTEDISQEVLVAVARSIHRYRGEAKFTTWLYSVARNVSVSHLRRTRPMGELRPDDQFDDGARRRLSSLVTERDVVREAIGSLPAKFGRTVLLRDIEGLSYAEIAEREGLEINTVRSRLSRGRAMLALRLP